MLSDIGVGKGDLELMLYRSDKDEGIEVMELGGIPKTSTVTLVASASALLATGTTSLAGRKGLSVENLGKVTLVVSDTSSSTSPIDGVKIFPGQKRIFTFSPADDTAVVNLYGRSVGYSTEARITEWK